MCAPAPPDLASTTGLSARFPARLPGKDVPCQPPNHGSRSRVRVHCQALRPQRTSSALRRGRPAGGRGRVPRAGAAAAWGAGAFHSAASSAGGQGAPAPATRPVKRQDLSSVTPVSATLGYAGSYTVRGQGSGALTWLPSPGQVIRQGQALYWTDITDPVVLLYGSLPAWRTLDEGVIGADVTQLNHDLVRLGDASRSEIRSLGWDYFSWETKAGVEKLQSALGVSSPPGSLSPGSVVFEPAALRVARAALGDRGLLALAGLIGRLLAAERPSRALTAADVPVVGGVPGRAIPAGPDPGVSH